MFLLAGIFFLVLCLTMAVATVILGAFTGLGIWGIVTVIFDTNTLISDRFWSMLILIFTVSWGAFLTYEAAMQTLSFAQHLIRVTG